MSNYLDTQSSKSSFGKIGLTLLTLVSVYMMMGKCQESDSLMEYEGSSSILTSNWREEVDMAPVKKLKLAPKEVGI